MGLNTRWSATFSPPSGPRSRRAKMERGPGENLLQILQPLSPPSDFSHSNGGKTKMIRKYYSTKLSMAKML
jgi:hypothetical protein